MASEEPIGDDEVILRRIPPSRLGMDSTKPLPNGRRATSLHLATKPGEVGLSCSRLRQTSPRELLAELVGADIDPTGWMVCRIWVRDVRQLKLEVIHKPTARDNGHCEILGASGMLAFPNNQNSRLAKETRILTDDEVATLNAGDLPVE